MEAGGAGEVLSSGEEGGESASGCGCDRVAEEGWEGVSDAGEPGASGEDAEGDGWVGFSGFSLPRKWPTLVDDETGAKMGHPVCGGSVRCGRPVRKLCDILAVPAKVGLFPPLVKAEEKIPPIRRREVV